VVAFLRAFGDDDVDAVVALVDEDIEYTNVSLPTVHGRARFEELTRRVLRPDRLGFRAHLTHHVMSDGNVVLTDRVDELRVRRFAMRFWVYGRFVVCDGRITVRRDSFDWFDVTVAARRSLAGLVSPGLDRRMPGD
jgi:limonene-1,2-epoxide hydrolase